MEAKFRALCPLSGPGGLPATVMLTWPRSGLLLGSGCGLQKVPSWCLYWSHMVRGSRDSVQAQRFGKLHLDLWEGHRGLHSQGELSGYPGHLLTCFVPLGTHNACWPDCSLLVILACINPCLWGLECNSVRESICLVCTKLSPLSLV